ncbi:MAG: hypothetical protein HS126_35860 [Anaerolineales bacterium]|nr:hypothetical protein [Anaerolineales bacterium]
MDGMSLLLGGVLGVLAGWAFSSASTKQREASTKLSKVNKTKEEMSKMEGEAKDNEEASFADAIQSFLLRLLGFVVIVVLGAIFFYSLG